MRLVLFLLILESAAAQSFIRFDPPVVTHCTASGLGAGTVSFHDDGPGAVQVRVGTADGGALTGLVPPDGSATTGDWVTDGMAFILTDGGSQELARTTAVVRCNPPGEVLAPALAAASYFPLQVGDEWIYIFNSRISTFSYVTRRIVRVDLIGDVAWFVISEAVGTLPGSESWFRNDDSGRIYQLINNQEQLWLDPSVPADPSALLMITGRGGAVQVPAGRFQDSLGYKVFRGALDLETGSFARGIGLVTNSHTSLTGSSGGFTEGLTLVYAKIDGHVVFGSPVVSLELATEANRFDITGKQAPNCAVPCYFVACGLAPGADPPGTYKPCFQARVRLAQTGSDVQSCDLDLLDSSNNSVYHATLTGTPDRESILVQQVRLYAPYQYPATPQPFPPGNYQLRAQTPDGRMSIAPIVLK